MRNLLILEHNNKQVNGLLSDDNRRKLHESLQYVSRASNAVLWPHLLPKKTKKITINKTGMLFLFINYQKIQFLNLLQEIKDDTIVLHYTYR